jgi:D-glycero-D-manno-heptose 1,7-bisphosphate phosphatase
MQFPDITLRKAIFLDKDGTLVRDVPYNVDPALVVMENGVWEGLAALQEQGYILVIISNQPGIALQLFTEVQLRDLISYMSGLFTKNGLQLAGFYHCPHLPANENYGCDCRKPQPGMLLQAARELFIDLKKSWMIGDILNDVEAGSRAGCQTILINNGNETEWEQGPGRQPDYTAADFLDATDHILQKTEEYA